MLKEIEKSINAIDEDAVYTPKQIVEMGIVRNNSMAPSRFTLYRYIERGQLTAAIRQGTEAKPRYFVKGRDLKKFLRGLYDLQPA